MRKVLLFPALLLACLAVAALAAVAATSRTAAREIERRVLEVRRANALAFRIAHLTVEEEREVFAYRFEPQPAALARIAAADAEMEAVAREIGSVDAPARGRRLWAEVLEARSVRSREQRRLLAAVDRRDPVAIARAYARWNLASGKASQLVADLSVFNLRRLERAIADLERVRSRSIALLVMVLAASAVVVAAFSLIVDRHLVRPVRAMTEAARRIAADLEEIAVPGGERADELGVLARAITRTGGDLVRANTALARSVAARDEFLSIASHELKTPLTALKLHVQGAVRRWEGGVPSWLQASVRQIERIEALVAELLDLARIRAGRLTLRPQRVDLSELARGVAERLREVLARTGNVLDVEIAEGIRSECDAGRIEQVLANLLANAAQHAPGAHVRLRADREGEVARVSVEDDGPGIPPDARERVFLPYEKVDRAQRGPGLGLGLYIARQIIEAHGGRIHAGAAAAGGVAFTLELPALRAAGDRPADPAPGVARAP